MQSIFILYCWLACETLWICLPDGWIDIVKVYKADLIGFCLVYSALKNAHEQHLLCFCVSPSDTFLTFTETHTHTHTFRAGDLHSRVADSLSLGRNTLLQAKALATSWAHSSLSLSSLSVPCFLYLTPFRQDSAQPILCFHSESQAGVIRQQHSTRHRWVCNCSISFYPC